MLKYVVSTLRPNIVVGIGVVGGIGRFYQSGNFKNSRMFNRELDICIDVDNAATFEVYK